MSRRIIYTPEAQDEIAESYGWYEEREPGLGESFLRSVEACVLLIDRHPHLFPIAIDQFRRAPIRRYPFEIFYEAADECVNVYAVFHCSKNPAKWRKRLADKRSL